ncbi:hypothetical protein RS9916_29394 [Synechococcus sp. RS9916]|nr:hypothetical protein RS9916_29394 [Synechococcus sp. RS9916]
MTWVNDGCDLDHFTWEFERDARNESLSIICTANDDQVSITIGTISETPSDEPPNSGGQQITWVALRL